MVYSPVAYATFKRLDRMIDESVIDKINTGLVSATKDADKLARLNLAEVFKQLIKAVSQDETQHATPATAEQVDALTQTLSALFKLIINNGSDDQRETLFALGRDVISHRTQAPLVARCIGDVLKQHSKFIFERMTQYLGEIYEVPPGFAFDEYLRDVFESPAAYYAWLGHQFGHELVQGREYFELWEKVLIFLNTNLTLQQAFINGYFTLLADNAPDIGQAAKIYLIGAGQRYTLALCNRNGDQLAIYTPQIYSELGVDLVQAMPLFQFFDPLTQETLLKKYSVDVFVAGGHEALAQHRANEPDYWVQLFMEVSPTKRGHYTVLSDVIEAYNTGRIQREAIECVLGLLGNNPIYFVPAMIRAIHGAADIKHQGIGWGDPSQRGKKFEFYKIFNDFPALTLTLFLAQYGTIVKDIVTYVLTDNQPRFQKALNKVALANPDHRHGFTYYLSLIPEWHKRKEYILDAIGSLHIALEQAKNVSSVDVGSHGSQLTHHLRLNDPSKYYQILFLKNLEDGRIKPLQADKALSNAIQAFRMLDNYFHSPSLTATQQRATPIGTTARHSLPKFGMALDRERFRLDDEPNLQKQIWAAWLLTELTHINVDDPAAYFKILMHVKQHLKSVKKISVLSDYINSMNALIDVIALHPPAYIKTEFETWLRESFPKGIFRSYPKFYNSLVEGLDTVDAAPDRAKLSNTVLALFYMLCARPPISCEPIVFDAKAYQHDKYLYPSGIEHGMYDGAVLKHLVNNLIALLEGFDRVRIDSPARPRLIANVSVTYFEKNKPEPIYKRTDLTRTKETFYWVMVFALATAKPEFVPDILSRLKTTLFAMSGSNKLKGTLTKLKRRLDTSEFEKQCGALIEALKRYSPEETIQIARTLLEDGYFSKETPYIIAFGVYLFDLSSVMGRFAESTQPAGVFEGDAAPQSTEAHVYLMRMFTACYAINAGKQRGTLHAQKNATLVNSIRHFLACVNHPSPDSDIHAALQKIETEMHARFKNLHYPMHVKSEGVDTNVVKLIFTENGLKVIQGRGYDIYFKAARPEALPAPDYDPAVAAQLSQNATTHVTRRTHTFGGL